MIYPAVTPSSRFTAGAPSAPTRLPHRLIQPRFAPVERQRRAEVSEDLNLDEALDRYIDNSAELQQYRQELKDHALQLERALELGQREENNSSLSSSYKTSSATAKTFPCSTSANSTSPPNR